MAQPRDYTRQYNFNDFQTTSPSDPLPGTQVDNELNAVKLTLDDLNENIEKIQRDDGKLKNQAVHKDAFDAGALALVNADSFNPRGDWVTARAYAINDIVDFNGATYLATVAHTSSAAFGTDQDADKWILLANAAISTTASAVDKYEGDGSQTVFTLQYNYAGDTSALVFVNGALRNPGDDYTISGNTITFVTAPSTPSVAGNENVIVWGASVVAQAAKEDAEAAESNASGFADEAEDWATKTTGQVESTDYSSKAYAIGGTGVDTGDGSAKDWATKTSAGVGNTSEYSAKEYAQGTQSGTGGSAKDWAQKTSGTVDGTNYSAKYWATDTNVTNVGSNITDVQTVAGEISPTNNIATVAGDSADIQTVASDSADIQQVADDSADIRTLADIQDGTTATNAITDVASIATNVTQVGPNINDVVTVAGQISPTNNIATVAGDSADIQTVANDSADIQQVADDSADIRIVADLQDGTTATNAISDLAAIASNITTVATNVQDVNNFAETYYISATEPANTTLGDLWFDTTDDVMKVKASNGFVNAGSSVNGTAQRELYVAGTASGIYNGVSLTTFPVTYDAGFIDVYLNGVKMRIGTDVVATSGTDITFANAVNSGDIVDIIAFGTFELSNFSVGDANDVDLTNKADGKVLVYSSANSRFEIGTGSAPEVYGFHRNSDGELIVTTTNKGVDDITASQYDAFDDVLFASSGFTFSINSNGNLTTTL
ncbi:MAG: carbohydrate-binding protein [Pontibacterium sp.]